MFYRCLNFCRNIPLKINSFSFKKQKGSILFPVIFLTAALLLLGTVFLRGSRQERFIAKSYTAKIKAHYIAEAGVEAALSLLNDQPDYFLHYPEIEPVYIGNGPAAEYFTLEWLDPGHSLGYKNYYTLVSRGYYSPAPGERSAQAVIKIFIDIVAQENGEENKDTEGTDIVVYGFYGY